MQILYGFIPWTPRNIYLTPAPAQTATPTQTETATPKPNNATTPTKPDPAIHEMIQFRTALMKVLNGFPDAKKAVIAYLVKAANLPAPPVWAT
jgi:hypothetical protein